MIIADVLMRSATNWVDFDLAVIYCPIARPILPNFPLLKLKTDLHDGGHAHRGEVELVDGLDLHPGGEGARRLHVLGEHVGRAVALLEAVLLAAAVVLLRGLDLVAHAPRPTHRVDQGARLVAPKPCCGGDRCMLH